MQGVIFFSNQFSNTFLLIGKQKDIPLGEIKKFQIRPPI